MLKSGQQQRLTILDLDERGHGFGNCDNVTVHVAGTAPDDEVTARVEHVSPHRPQAWGALQTVHRRGDHFREPECPNAAPLRGSCGGCPVLHVDQEAQLSWKLDHARKALADLSTQPEKLQSVGPRLHYRARSNYVFGLVEQQATLGSWAPRSHDLARMDGCLAVRPIIANVATRLETLLDAHQIPASPASPALRYVTLRAGTAGDVLVDFVVESDTLPRLNELVNSTFALDGVAGVSVAINQSAGNAIRVSNSSLMLGSETVDEVLGDIVLTASAASFTQLNGAVATAMYQQAASWLAGCVPEAGTVLDLYCGLGGLGMTLAHRRPDLSVVGAESHDASVRLAAKGAQKNGLAERCRFVTQDLRNGVVESEDPGGLFINPPRRGIDERQLEFLATSRVPVVYMSCSPSSFARDVQALRNAGLKLTAVEAWDMLPQTAHVELIGMLMPE